MKKVRLVLFIFLSSFILIFVSKSFAAGPAPPPPGGGGTVKGCSAPNVCAKTCTSSYPYQVSSCTNAAGIAGACCSQTPPSNAPGTFQWGGWGDPNGKEPLSNFSNLLKPGGVNNTPRATWENVLSTLISLTFFAAIVVALAYLILGGYNWVFSGGDKQKIAGARQHVVFAIIGLVIVFISLLIITVIGSFFKINFLNLP